MRREEVFAKPAELSSKEQHACIRVRGLGKKLYPLQALTIWLAASRA